MMAFLELVKCYTHRIEYWRCSFAAFFSSVLDLRCHLWTPLQEAPPSVLLQVKKNIHFSHFFTLKCGSPIVLMYGIIYVRKLWLLWYGAQTGLMYLFSVVFTPSPPSHYGNVWVLPVISLLLTNTVSPVRACLSTWWEKFRGTQYHQTILGLLIRHQV